MSAVREFPSVSVNNNNNVIQINTNDSNFSVVPGSVIFIAGDRPRVVTSGDTVNRTLTLAIAYIGNDIVEKSATLIPLGQNDALLSAITSLTEAQNGLGGAYNEFLSLYQYLEARVVALEACHSCGGATDSDTLLRDINGDLLFDIEGNQLKALPQ